MKNGSSCDASGGGHSAWIDNAKVVSIAAVVLLHVSTIAMAESPVGSPTWWLSALLGSATRWGVPMFVIVSGAALLAPDRTEPALVFYRKRMARVLLPLLFWSLFYVLWATSIAAAKAAPLDLPNRLLLWLQGRPYYHLWFLYMMLGLYLATPWLRLVIRDMPSRSLCQAVCVLFTVAAAEGLWRGLGWLSGQTFFLTWGLSYLPYFLLGGLLARSRAGVMPEGSARWGVLLLAWIVAMGVAYGALAGQPRSPSNTRWLGYWLDSNGLPVILLSLFALPLLSRWHWPLFGASCTARTATLSFGVYLIHPAVLDVLRAAKLQQLPLSWSAAAALLLGGTVTVLAASFGTVALLSRLPYLRKLT